MTSLDTETEDCDRREEPVTISFVCVQNAGRSQMAAAFAELERHERGLEDRMRIRTGGTDPADAAHDVVVTAMDEVGVDLSGQTPREITPATIDASDVVITMGCSADGLCPATWWGDSRDWDLDDPHGRPVDEVRRIREEIRRRVDALFDELESNGAT